MTAPTDFKSLVLFIVNIINSLLPVIAGLALLVFFYGLVIFINKSGDAKTHSEGRRFMIWGIIALFILFSFEAIISFFYRDFGFGGGLGLPIIPPR